MTGTTRLATSLSTRRSGASTRLGASGSFGSGTVTVGSNHGNWVRNADNYFAFRFVASDSLPHYGWGRMTVGAALTGRTL